MAGNLQGESSPPQAPRKGEGLVGSGCLSPPLALNKGQMRIAILAETKVLGGHNNFQPLKERSIPCEYREQHQGQADLQAAGDQQRFVVLEWNVTLQRGCLFLLYFSPKREIQLGMWWGDEMVYGRFSWASWKRKPCKLKDKATPLESHRRPCPMDF